VCRGGNKCSGESPLGTPAHTGYFELGQPELNACHRLLEQEKETIKRQDASVEGFNVGIKVGEVAGQTTSIALYT